MAGSSAAATTATAASTGFICCKAARPLLGKLGGLRSELTATAMEGINPSDAHRLLGQLETIKENVRNAIQSANEETQKKEAALWLIPC